MSAAGKSLRKMLHQDAVVAWKAEGTRLRNNGLVMKGAGPKPCEWCIWRQQIPIILPCHLKILLCLLYTVSDQAN